MDLSEAHKAAGLPHWDARLELAYARRGERTVLARREHCGPLRVQRDLYPEGEGTCHTIIVHPPGGIAGGDRLALGVELGAGSRALLTTPGAGKWYRTDGAAAGQTLAFDVQAGASLEWLPMESIVFNGAVADMQTTVNLGEGATYFGWEILCLGRTASGERFERGRLCTRTELRRDGRRLWLEQGRLDGNDPLMASPVGLDGHSVCGTLVAAGRDIPDDLLAACRAVRAGDGAKGGITRLPGVCVARWLGDASEDARRWFASLWSILRPALHGGAAAPPRIWAT